MSKRKIEKIGKKPKKTKRRMREFTDPAARAQASTRSEPARGEEALLHSGIKLVRSRERQLTGGGLDVSNMLRAGPGRFFSSADKKFISGRKYRTGRN